MSDLDRFRAIISGGDGSFRVDIRDVSLVHPVAVGTFVIASTGAVLGSFACGVLQYREELFELFVETAGCNSSTLTWPTTIIDSNFSERLVARGIAIPIDRWNCLFVPKADRLKSPSS